MTLPSELLELSPNSKQPYTESVVEFWNIKPRWAYCKKCEYKVLTNLPGPVCSFCHQYLITIVERYELKDMS